MIDWLIKFLRFFILSLYSLPTAINFESLSKQNNIRVQISQVSQTFLFESVSIPHTSQICNTRTQRWLVGWWVIAAAASQSSPYHNNFNPINDSIPNLSVSSGLPAAATSTEARVSWIESNLEQKNQVTQQPRLLPLLKLPHTMKVIFIQRRRRFVVVVQHRRRRSTIFEENYLVLRWLPWLHYELTQNGRGIWGKCTGLDY